MAEATLLIGGLTFPESPRWHDERLWFADWATREVAAVDLAGTKEVILRIPSARPGPGTSAGGPAQGPFSLDWLSDGRLLIVAGRDRLLLRQDLDGSLVTHVDLGGQAWNEIVVDGRGNIYLDAVGFDFVAGEAFAPGSVAFLKPDGSLETVGDGIAFPNGMAVTPDDGTLIVADSYGRKLVAFDIAEAGTLSGQRTWAELGDGSPDGICLDSDGAVWYADVPNQRCVRVREGGQVLDTIAVDRGCFSCTLGGPDGRTLFIVASEWRGPAAAASLVGTGQVLIADAPAPGVGWS
jgi:sugar lactone lactonase YvrE